jgi:hypothetical protein
MMSEIPTAEEFSDKFRFTEDHGGDICYEGIYKFAIKFTKLHVEAALKAASENACTKKVEWGLGVDIEVDENSILTSYPLENIK